MWPERGGGERGSKPLQSESMKLEREGETERVMYPIGFPCMVRGSSEKMEDKLNLIFSAPKNPIFF